MTHTPAQALAGARFQSQHGPRFAVGLCKQKTRELFGVPSDGSKSAAESWSRTKHRVRPVPHGADPQAGLLVWWTGGSHRFGHVALSAGGGRCWSVDIKRPGYFDLVDIDSIARTWPGLHLAGYSADIDGVTVYTAPATRGEHLDKAIRHLEVADRPAHAAEVKKALDILKGIPPIKAGQ